MPLPRFDKLEDSRRKAILGFAAEEFAEHGRQGASLNRILERAQLSKGAAYYYFADKDDLYVTVLQHTLGRWTEVMPPPYAGDDPAEFWQAAERAHGAMLRFFFDSPVDARLFWQVTRERERGEAHPALSTLYDRWHDMTRIAVLYGQSIGAVRQDVPTELLISLTFSVFEGIDRWLVRCWDDVKSQDVDEVAAQAIGLLRRMAEPERNGP